MDLLCVLQFEFNICHKILRLHLQHQSFPRELFNHDLKACLLCRHFQNTWPALNSPNTLHIALYCIGVASTMIWQYLVCELCQTLCEQAFHQTLGGWTPLPWCYCLLCWNIQALKRTTLGRNWVKKKWPITFWSSSSNHHNTCTEICCTFTLWNPPKSNRAYWKTTKEGETHEKEVKRGLGPPVLNAEFMSCHCIMKVEGNRTLYATNILSSLPAFIDLLWTFPRILIAMLVCIASSWFGMMLSFWNIILLICGSCNPEPFSTLCIIYSIEIDLSYLCPLYKTNMKP